MQDHHVSVRTRLIEQLEARHAAAMEEYWRLGRLKLEALRRAEEYADLLDDLETKRCDCETDCPKYSGTCQYQS